MAVVYLVMGKSASGKDTVFQKLREDTRFGFHTVIPYTTRPKREGEKEGREYYFVSQEQFFAMQRKEYVIEYRTYQTVHGEWTYFTADDGQIDMKTSARYLLIGTLETYENIRNFYRQKGRQDVWITEHIRPIYLEVEDGERLYRALFRERMQEKPRYAELCRRFLADEHDFSEERLAAVGIQKRFQNDDVNVCLEKIASSLFEEILV